MKKINSLIFSKKRASSTGISVTLITRAKTGLCAHKIKKQESLNRELLPSEIRMVKLDTCSIYNKENPTGDEKCILNEDIRQVIYNIPQYNY